MKSMSPKYAIRTRALPLSSRLLPIITLLLLPGLPVTRAGENPAPAATRPAAYDLEINDGMLMQDGKKTEATLANVVEILRTRFDHANIVLAPGLGRLKVADLKLRGGQLQNELEAIRVASGEKFDIQGPREAPAVIDPKTGLPLSASPEMMAGNSGLYTLQAASSPGSERAVEAFNLEPFLASLRHPAAGEENAKDQTEREEHSIDELTRMVTETLEMLNTDGRPPDQPAFRFHRGASVLVVIGTRESVEVARKIVNALPGMATAQRGESSAANTAAREAFMRRYGLGPPDNPGPTDLPPAKK